MLYEQKNSRSFLKTAMQQNVRGGPASTLSALSTRLGISTSYLSEVLSGKKSLSMELAFKIAVKLNLTETETQYFCLLVQIEQEKDIEFRGELEKRLQQLNPRRQSYDLSADLFKAISEWYHLVILELTFLKGLVLTPQSIAKKIGVTKEEADGALKRLMRLGLLTVDPQGQYVKSQDFMYGESFVPNESFQKFHIQMLQKAILSLHSQTPKERISATDVLAIDSKHLPEVDRLSQEFSSAVQKIGDKSKIKNEVYVLTTHFYRVTEE